MRIQLLGPLRVWRDDGREVDLGPPARRAVLGLLALAGGDPVPVAELVDALWGDRPPARATNVVQTHVKHLRRLLEPDRPARTPSALLPSANGGYAVRVPTDAGAFREAVAPADRADDPARAVELCREALALWQGRPLADVPLLAGHPEVVALDAERRRALTRYAEAAIAAGRAREALPVLAGAAGAEPLDEHLQACLIHLQRAAGRRAEAFAGYREVRDRLADELGVSPGAELAGAYAALLADDAEEPWAGPVRTPAQLPADVGGLTGRAAELAELDGAAAAGLVVVSGTAGVGKTALVVHWAHRARDRYPDGQLHHDLRGHSGERPARPVEVLAHFLASLGVPADQVPVDVRSASALLRTALRGRRVLLVLDNAVDADQVRPLLPGHPGCAVVVTSRERAVGLVARDGARQLVLDVLPPAEAVRLLTAALGTRRTASEPGAARELARLCAGLPLALRIAAARLVDHGDCTIADHVAQLRGDDPLAVLEVPGDEQATVRRAFDPSYAALPAEARRVFRLLGLVPGADFGDEAVAALCGLPREAAGRALDRLARAHLVDRHLPGRYRFHDLLRSYAVALASAEDADDVRRAASARLHAWYLDRTDAAARVLYPHLLRLPPADPANPTTSAGGADLVEPSGAGGSSGPGRPADAGGSAGAPGSGTGFAGSAEASTWLDVERANLVATACAAGAPVAWLLADALRGYFWLAPHAVDWSAVAEAGLAAASGPGAGRARAACRLSLGDVGFRLGHYRAAVHHYAHALVLARRAGWAECAAAVSGNLGCVYWQRGRLRPAVAHFDRALASSRQVGSTAGEAAAVGNLGLVRREMGELDLAADAYGRASELYRRIGSRYGEAINLLNLGHVRHDQARTGEAARLARQALVVQAETGDRSGAAGAHALLAAVLRDTGHPREALDHARTGLGLALDVADPRAEAEALVVSGGVHLRTGAREAAAVDFGRALAAVRRTGDRYPEVEASIGLAEARGDLAGALGALGAAERCGYRCLAATASTSVARTLAAQGEWRGAEAHARRAAEAARATGHRLGEARALLVQGRALDELGDPAAEAVWREAFDRCAAAGMPEALPVHRRLAAPVDRWR
ncbi:BTAD domain-containing putative transcriptional regulator [Actinosynnema sp. NPDC050436]|uniref:BTAD domain-containing putative transcriptional regulator n=1 Tax=Actinosynnema sp. NPDC050436 TaxID=3155659 RepID=UPI0033F8217E